MQLASVKVQVAQELLIGDLRRDAYICWLNGNYTDRTGAR